MKFPKNRANIYFVVRDDLNGSGDLFHTAILGAFSELEEADNYKDACAAEWFDKKANRFAQFYVRMSTYYG